MNEANRERILDAYLEEVLGGHYPPDLTAKILQTWQTRCGEVELTTAAEFVAASPLLTTPEASLAYTPTPPPVQFAAPPLPDIFAEPLAEPAPRSRPHRRSRAPSGWLVLAAGTLAAAASLLVYVLQEQPNGPPVARFENSKQPGTTLSGRPNQAHRGVRPAGPKVVAVPRERTPREKWSPQRVTPRLASTRVTKGDSPRPPLPQRKLRKPSPDSEIIAFVDQALKQAWREHGVTPSPPVGEMQWCQRVYERLIGREPSKDEIDRFAKSKIADKRQSLVEQLLASDEYARHWAGLWAATLLGSDARKDHAADGEPLQDYLQAALQANQPYDKLVQELLSASGSTRRGAEDYNGAVNFLVAGAAHQAVEATDRTARVFLGRQLVCTQCHDQPTAGREQGEFWQLNAFFRQMQVQRGPSQDVATLTDADFPGESGAAKDAEIFYRLPDGRLRIAYPALNGYEVPHSGLVRDVRRRQELAQLVILADDFPRAVVNRLWATLLGYGFVQPVDDLGPHNPPAQPQLFERLSDELAAHEFDLKGLTRWIVLSEPFRLSDRRMPESWMDAPEKGGQPLFARCYLPGKPPRDVYKSLMLAVNSRPKSHGSEAGIIAAGFYGRRTWTNTGNLEIIEPQTAQATPGNGWLERLATSPLKPERKVEHVFLSAQGRLPSPREMTAAKLLLADRLDEALALSEIWRALLASGEAGLDR
ncbi:MAG: DUF1549 domain-containing protein [Planctomycetota bacterium]|nr:DUF1549 domain-containing protein [Planctomycetota bacterium]